MSRSAADRQVVHSLLAAAGIRPSKRLGQNFLVDPMAVTAIENQVARESVGTIVEVGPGFGAVTEALLHHAQTVLAIETDRRLVGLLRDRLGGDPRLRIMHRDVLSVDLAEEPAVSKAHLVGSLPYRITAAILKWMIDQRSRLQAATVITQREVAEKIATSPGRHGTALGVLVRAYGEVEIVREIARGSFFPVPDVDSTLWTIRFRDRPRFAAAPDAFFTIVRTLYGGRRKMIRRVLRSIVPVDAVSSILQAAGIDGTARGEELGFAELDRLAIAADRWVEHRSLKRPPP